MKVFEYNIEIELYRKEFYPISIMDIEGNINYMIDFKCFFISYVMEIINITEYDDLNSIFELYNNHQNEAFIYLADLQLFKLFIRLKFCKIFLARINNMAIGFLIPLIFIISFFISESLKKYFDFFINNVKRLLIFYFKLMRR